MVSAECCAKAEGQRWRACACRADAMRAEGGRAGTRKRAILGSGGSGGVRGVAGREGRYAPGQQSHLASDAYGKREDGVDVGP